MATFYASLGSQYQLQLDVNQSSQDIPTNTSIVSWTLRINKLSGSGRYTFSADSSSVTINGSTYGTSFTYDFRSYSSLLIQSGTTSVVHDSDGTKTISVSGTFNDVQANLGAGTASGTLTLTPIPRASVPTLSASTVDAGVAVTINTNRVSTSFTHTIEYDFVSLTGQTSGLAASSGVTTSTTLTPPLALLNEIPNALSGTLVVRVTTFNGATQIGSPQTVNLSVTVPASVVPTIGTLTATEGTVVPDVATLIGAFVQSVSKVAATIRVSGVSTAAGAYGSTIVSNKITVDGQTITGEFGTTVAALSSSGTVPVVAETTDSRGRKGTKTVNLTVLAYSLPTAPTVEARRSLTGGTVDQSNGTYIRVDMAATVASLINGTQKNLLQYRVSTSPSGANTWTVRQAATSTGASTLAFDSYTTPFPYIQITSGAPYSVTSSFDVKVEVLDKLSISSYIRTISLGKTLVDHNGNIGVSFGAYHSGGAFPLEIWGQGQQNGYDIVDKSLISTTSGRGLVELATSAETTTGTDTDRAVTPAGLLSAREVYVGTVAADFTIGLPSVVLDNATTVTATSMDYNVQPGDLVQVVKSPVSGLYHIVGKQKTNVDFPSQVDLRSALLNSWKWYHDSSAPNIDPSDNSKAYSIPRVTRTNVGWVQMQGLIRSGTLTIGTVLMNLPTKFRPLWNVRGLMCLSNGNVARIDVLINGDVVLQSTVTNAYIDLSGVHFINDPALTWTALTLSGTWLTNASTNDPTPAWAQDATGRVHIRGILKNTATTATLVVANMPTAQRYTQDTYLLTPVFDGTTYTNNRIDLQSNGDILSNNGTVARTNVFLNIAYLPGANPMDYLPNLVNASQYGVGYATRGFHKLSDGTVMLKGMFITSATGSGSVFIGLPPGLRPASRLITASMAAGTRGRTDILADGTVRFMEGTGTNWLSLDNITFVAEQ